MMTPDLISLRRLAQAATPGSWNWTYCGDSACDCAWLGSKEKPHVMFLCAGYGDDKIPSEADADFIAAVSPDVCLALLAEVERLKDALSEYGEHDKTDCILSRWEAGEPKPDGGYQMKYAGKWYDKDKLPKCQCGFDTALTGGA